MDKKVNIIKNINLNKIRSALRNAGTATKPQLAEATGLSVVTVNSLVNTLIDTGEIVPDVTMDSEGGRPAASFRYNSEFRMVLVIYMHEYRGQDTAFYCVANLRGEVMERNEHILSNVNVESFDSPIEKLICKYTRIKAICFGIPGEEVNQRLVISDYQNMREQSLSGHIKERFHLPVFVENDINAAIMGYCHQNKIREEQCVIGIYFPEKYPPGAGIYLNGKLYKGRNGLAGEIAYLPLGIDWAAFDYNPADAEDVMIKTIQAFLCMYNPDRIVLYGGNINPAVSALIQENCLTPAEKIMLPEIIISTDLNTDFEAGIKQIALNMIDTERDFNELQHG
jgi:Transcriptional regulator/sugar kinase